MNQPTVTYRRDQRTRSILLHFLRRNREDVQHFYHYLHNYIGHYVRRPHCGISLQPLEKVLDTLEEVDESIFAGFDVLGRL